ncbi:hypothetical protein [Algoriphagus sp. NG3]|uniref:hypothetical protein n=1 Tax=unclassified Algoriphagus TaxID=2641541 RepID=UPI002A83DCF1|nr:hypothetical protein [Algoriphagus sp. NG3]WPR76742.1 hypothetical protein SLW71_05235 [Algoriphagus sp. NG3]
MKSIKHISIVIQLLVMFAMLANGMLFTHVHRAQTGELITHAHPYSSDSDSPIDPGHSHSEQEYQTYDFVSLSKYIPHFVFIEICPNFSSVGSEYYQGKYKPVISTDFYQEPGRAPPVLSIG